MSALGVTTTLRSLLADIPARIAVERIDQIWIFEPREIGGQESGLLVVSCLPVDPDPGGQRQLLTVRYEQPRSGKRSAPAVTVVELGWAPAERLPRVIEGVVARLGQTEDPLQRSIDGRLERWSEMLDGLQPAQLDPENGE